MQAFAKAFDTTPDDLDMHIVYDVSHNIAKVEEHISYIHYKFSVSSKYLHWHGTPIGFGIGKPCELS